MLLVKYTPCPSTLLAGLLEFYGLFIFFIKLGVGSNKNYLEDG